MCARSLLRRFDQFLRWVLDIRPVSDHPECVLRIRLRRAFEPIVLPDRTIAAGAAVLELHLWNERLPLIPSTGPDFCWAVQMQRQLIRSFQLLAIALNQEPRLREVQAIGGVSAIFAPEAATGERGLLHHLGFTVYPHRNRLGRMGEFWENLYAWGLMWTYNPASLRRRKLTQLCRMEVWISTQEFLRRYNNDRRHQSFMEDQEYAHEN